MQGKSYRMQWRAHIDELMEKKKDQYGMWMGYFGLFLWVEENGGRFKEWERTMEPHGILDSDLGRAVDIGCINPFHPYYSAFLEWANEAADRALSDPRFSYGPGETGARDESGRALLRGWRIEGVYPGNHGATVAAACLARALRDNCELDRPTLLQACDEISESALHGGSARWDYLAESDYLRSVRLSLVAGEVGKARHLLNSIRRKFKKTFVHLQWLESLVNAIDASNPNAPISSEQAQRFQHLFDEVRNPACRGLPKNQTGGVNLSGHISILRLEMAIIKQRYVLAHPLEGWWQQVLGLISE